MPVLIIEIEHITTEHSTETSADHSAKVRVYAERSRDGSVEVTAVDSLKDTTEAVVEAIIQYLRGHHLYYSVYCT